MAANYRCTGAYDLRILDKTAKELKLNIDASEKQKLKLEKTVNELLDQYSSDRATLKYILRVLINGTGIIIQTPKKQEGVGGKAKRRRRKGGGVVDDHEKCIIGYFENFTITNTDIKRNDRTGVYTVTITELKDKADLSKPVIPEVSELIDKYDNAQNNLEKIVYAEKIIKEFELTTKGIDFTVVTNFNESKTNAIDCVSKAKEKTKIDADGDGATIMRGGVKIPASVTQEKAGRYTYQNNTAPVPYNLAVPAASAAVRDADLAAAKRAAPVAPPVSSVAARAAAARAAATARAASAATTARKFAESVSAVAEKAIKEDHTASIQRKKDILAASEKSKNAIGNAISNVRKAVANKFSSSVEDSIVDCSNEIYIFIGNLQSLLNDNNNKIKIIKSRYNNHPMIIIDKKLQSLV